MREKYTEKQAVQDLAAELILYMKEYEDGDAFDMVQDIIIDLDLDLHEEISGLNDFFESI